MFFIGPKLSAYYFWLKNEQLVVVTTEGIKIEKTEATEIYFIFYHNNSQNIFAPKRVWLCP